MLKKTFITFVCLFAIILLCAIFSLYSTTGAKNTIKLVNKISNFHIQYENFEGNLGSHFTFSNLKLTSSDSDIEIKSVELDWSLWKIMIKRLWINQLHVQDLTINSHEQRKTTHTASSSNKHISFEIPITFNLNDIEINNITLTTPSIIKKFDNIKLQASYLNDTILVKQFQIHSKILEANLQGMLTSDEEKPLKMNGSFHFNDEGVKSNVDLNINGKYSQYQLKLNGKIQSEQFPHTAISLNAIGNAGKLSLETMLVKSQHGSLHAKGKLSLFPILSWDIDLNAKHLNLEFIDEELVSSINAVMHSKTDFEKDDTISMQIKSLNGRYRNQRLSGKVDIQFGERLAINDFQIHLGNANIIASNINKNSENIQWTFVIPELNDFSPNLKGFVESFGEISNLNSEPEIKAQVKTKNMVVIANETIQNINGKLLTHFILKKQSNHHYPVGELSGHCTADLPDLNIKVSNANLDIKGNNSGILDYDIQLKTNNLLSIKGKTDLASKYYETNAFIKGNNIKISDNDDISLSISPELNLTIDKNLFSLTGNLMIPSANLAPKDFSSTTTLPKDVEYVNAQGKIQENDLDLPFSSNILINLGEHVKINIKGLKADLSGQLRVIDQPSQETKANGEIIASNGEFAMYGTELTLNRARIHFAGPIDNPGLDIQASKKFNLTNTTNNPFDAKKLIVGVLFQGNANKPNISLYSDPAILSKADILSYLILGFPANQASSNQATLLMKAASGLAGGGSADGLMKDLQTSLGLSDLSFESSSTVDAKSKETTQSRSLVVGKYLSPKLYINYSVGVMNSVNIFKVNYRFKKNWSVQTNSSTLGNGADILYSVEKN